MPPLKQPRRERIYNIYRNITISRLDDAFPPLVYSLHEYSRNLVLPDEINLSNPAMATTYAGVQYTTDKGQTFHGKPISFSVAVLKNANNPQAALHLVEFLLSPAGQKLVQDAHFLPSPVLVGGDATFVPNQLRVLIQGNYQYSG